MTLSLHVIGCSPAWPNPGEPCSSYLVETGGTRFLLDLGSGSLAELLERDDAPVAAIVLSHLHWDHTADLVPLTYGLRYGWLSGWPRPALWAPPGGRDHLSRVGDVAMGDAAFFEQSLDVAEYDPASGLSLGDTRVTFRAMPHAGTSHAIRVESDGASLCYSGDTGPTPELAEHARGVGLFLCEAGSGDQDQPSSEHHRGGEAGAAATAAACDRLVLTHVEAPRRDATLRLARERYAGPVELAHPGLRVAVPATVT